MNKKPAPPPRRTEAQSAASRINGAKARGRPKGKMSKARITLMERIRMSEPEIVKRLMFLMRKGENHAVQLAACRELLDRGYGRPFQAVAVGMEGGGTVDVFTGVPRVRVRWENDSDLPLLMHQRRDPLEGLPPRYPPLGKPQD
jgi:hypothetical protein